MLASGCLLLTFCWFPLCIDVRLDLKTNQWEELPQQKDTPSARSGHRMVVYRNFLLLFGGFYEVLHFSLCV